MRNLLLLIQQVAQQGPGPIGPGGPPGGEEGFSVKDMLTELISFIGYFLSVGAIGFRFGIARRARGITDDARSILAADKAATFGLIGVILVALSVIGAPWLEALSSGKAFSAVLPRGAGLGRFEFKVAMLALALVGFAIVRAAPTFGWFLAAIGIVFTVLQPLYTGRGAGKVNAVHVLAASTWLGTLLVLFLVGIHGVIRRGPAGAPRARLVADLVNSFSPLALTAATVVALTGLTTAWMHLKRISSLWTTSYGITLDIKLVLVLIVVSLGAWNWKRVKPSLGEAGSEETIRRSSRMELTFAALVLIATSVLVTLPSPH